MPTELDRQYRFSAPELKAGCHRLDGVLWPIGNDSGSAELPVVLLEVQMRADTGFHHRLAAHTYRFLQLYPRIEHLSRVNPLGRLAAGPRTTDAPEDLRPPPAPGARHRGGNPCR